jgi:hypothetical protein
MTGTWSVGTIALEKCARRVGRVTGIADVAIQSSGGPSWRESFHAKIDSSVVGARVQTRRSGLGAVS